MPKQTVEVLVEGGKATAAPPLGPALGPMGVNIGQVVADINKKTASFAGMQVPVKVEVDSVTKTFSITIGTPPASSLITKEAGVPKGSGKPNQEKVADLAIEQIIKIAKMKEDVLLGKNLKNKVKEIMGTCDSMGILIEGVPAREAIRMVNEGKFDEPIRLQKTEISAEERKQLEEERKKLAVEHEKKMASIQKIVDQILKENEGKEKTFLRTKLREAGVPDDVILKAVPMEKAAAGDDKKGGAKKK